MKFRKKKGSQQMRKEVYCDECKVKMYKQR